MESSDLALFAALDALLQESSVSAAARRVGLSTPAMSHALARLRERLGDELLVRAGRGMVLTPRALELKPQIHQVVLDAQRAFVPTRPFVPTEVTQTFVVHASDYVLTVLGGAVDALLRREAPGLCVRFVPNTADDAAMVRDNGSDLAVGIYGDLPQEMRQRQLLTDRFVCVVRADHPVVGDRLTLHQFVQLRHVQVAPRGKPGGYVDDVLRERGLQRQVTRAVPYFLTALHLVAENDDVLTISERIVRPFASRLALKVLEPPLPLRPYALGLLWHPRVDDDAAQRFLRDVFVRAAQRVAHERHEAPRTRLDIGDPTSGQARRRPRSRR